MKKYEILGGNLPVVVCELSAGESMITESGSMSWMSPNMKMETISGGGMKKMFGRLMSGDSAFQNRYTAEGADGMIAFASSFPGAIKALEISNGHSMIVQKSAFLASEEGVELSMHFQKKLGKSAFEIRWRRYQFSGQARFHYRHGGNRKWFCGCRWKYA